MLFLPIWREFIVDWCAILCNKLWRTSSQIAKCHVNFGKTSGTAKNRFALCFRQNHKVGKIKKCTKEKAYPKGYAVSESSKCNGNDRRPNGDNHQHLKYKAETTTAIMAMWRRWWRMMSSKPHERRRALPASGLRRGIRSSRHYIITLFTSLWYAAP